MMDALLAEARVAQRTWAATPINERLRIVKRVRHGLASNAQTLGETVRAARQRTLHEALAGEVLPLAEACRFAEEEALKLLRPQRLPGRQPFWLWGVRAKRYREPFGVVLVIGPSNYPLFLAGVHTLQALVAGNAVVLKPGLQSKAVAEQWRNLWLAAGLDPRLFVLLDEDPAQATAAIHAGIDKVVLTGSMPTGQAVLAEIASPLIPATMELAGCDAAFVLPDANLDRTARALLFGLLWNDSATCIAPRRVFATDSQRAALVTALTALAPRQSIELPPHLTRLIHDAVDRGATLVLGTPTHGPTILCTPADVPLLQEAPFAPVLSLIAVADMAHALQLAAKSPYQLGATIFGTVGAPELAQQVSAGCVVVNDAIVPTADPRLAFGGRGHSGFGVTRGPEGLLEMTTLKVVVERRGRARHLEELAFADAELFRLYLAAVHGPTWFQRWRAKGALLRYLAARPMKEQQT